MCALVASGGNGSSGDHALGTVSSNASGSVLVTTLALENSNTHMLIPAGGTVSVWCKAPLAVEAHSVHITAIQVG